MEKSSAQHFKHSDEFWSHKEQHSNITESLLYKIPDCIYKICNIK